MYNIPREKAGGTKMKYLFIYLQLFIVVWLQSDGRGCPFKGLNERMGTSKW
jgi:hypothetical protein